MLQMEQKHQVEDIFAAAGLPFTALQASPLSLPPFAVQPLHR
jgi:hypothetical protein